MANTLRSTVETTDDPVVGFDHCVGQHRLPFRDANSQDRKPPVLREIAHAVGIIPFTLPAQTSHPMGRNAGKQILGEIDALQIFEPVEQPVGRRRVRARLELAQPHKTGHPIISRLLEQCQQLFSDRHRQPTGDPRLDASLGIDESRGTKPLDRGCRGKDSAGASALGYEATGDILVRHRHLGFSEQPFLQLARTTSGEGAEAVEPP